MAMRQASKPACDLAPADAGLASLLAEIRYARFGQQVSCVRCGARRVRRWGRFAGRQRYRCNTCRRTFSDLTDTPAAYLKRLTDLPAYRGCLQATLSIRASARALGIHPTTSFRWRHRLLRGMMPYDLPRLRGAVELEEGWVLCADAASKPRGRHPAWRRRRSLADPVERRSWIVALRDRAGRSTVESVGRARPDAACWADLLSVFVDPGSTVVTARGRLSAHAQAVRACGLALSHRHPRMRAPPAPLAASGSARELLCRVRRWLRRFRGVSSAYLANYLYWYGLVDPSRRTGIRLAQMLCWQYKPEAIDAAA